jgi:hypothetical protein
MILYLSHGAPTFPTGSTAGDGAEKIAGDWFIVEPRQDPTGMRGIDGLGRAGRRVLAIDLDAATCEVVHEGRWPTTELILPIRMRPETGYADEEPHGLIARVLRRRS